MNKQFLKVSRNLDAFARNIKSNKNTICYNGIRFNSSSLRNYVATNEPILDYKTNSTERNNLNQTLFNILNNKTGNQQDALFDVPIVIGDKEIRTNNVKYQLVPFDHKIKLARFYHADKSLLNDAIKNSLEARAGWENSSFDFRANILLKAADKLATTSRADILATTMLGQGKTVFQAGKIDNNFLLNFLIYHFNY